MIIINIDDTPNNAYLPSHGFLTSKSVKIRVSTFFPLSMPTTNMRPRVQHAIHPIEADRNRSADAHLIPLNLQAWPSALHRQA